MRNKFLLCYITDILGFVRVLMFPELPPLIDAIIRSALQVRLPLVAQLVENPPTMWETWVRSLVGRSPGEGKGYLLQYSGLENSMDCIDRGVTKSWT